MGLASSIKPISYVKANAAELLEKIAVSGEPLIITQNGEAKAVMVDIASWEKTQETLALLKLLAMSDEDIVAGRYKPAREVIERLRFKHKSR